MAKRYVNDIASLSLSFLVLIIATCTLMMVVFMRDIYISQGFFYALITMSVAFIPILNRFFRNDLNVFEPIVLSMVMLGVLFGVRPIAMYLVGDIEYFLWFPIFDFLDEAVLLGMLGTVMFYIGYLVDFNRKSDKNKEVVNKTRVYVPKGRLIYLYCGFFFLLSVLIFYFYVSASGSAINVIKMMYSGRSQALVDSLPLRSEYFSVAPILSACAAIVLIVSNNDKKMSGHDFLLTMIFILFPVLVFMLMGVRRFIIPSIFIPLVAYYLVRSKKPRLKYLFIIAPLVFLILSVVPYLRTEGARNNMQEGNESLIGYIIFNADKHISRFILSHDTEMVSALSVEVSALKTAEDYYYGRAVLGDLILAPIPSIVFPGKPMTARDGMLVDAFGAKCNATEGGLCPDFSIIGTFYQDFWYIGVIAGMFVVGRVSKLIWKKYLLNQGGAFNMVALSCWIVFLPIIIRAGFMPAFAWFLYFLIPSFMVLLLLRLQVSCKVMEGNCIENIKR